MLDQMHIASVNRASSVVAMSDGCMNILMAILQYHGAIVHHVEQLGFMTSAVMR